METPKTMHTRTQLFARTLLPTLILPVALLSAGSAHAELSISNGFLTDKVITTEGWDFSLGINGAVTLGGNTYPTAVNLDCSVDTGEQLVVCGGIMTLNGYEADIMMDYDSATGEGRWAMEAGLPAAANTVHEMWGEEIVPNTLSVPDGWGSVEYSASSSWRFFYYSISWAKVYVSITGMPYDEFLEIWTW